MSYQDLYQQSIEQPEVFWRKQAELIKWYELVDEILLPLLALDKQELSNVYRKHGLVKYYARLFVSLHSRTKYQYLPQSMIQLFWMRSVI